MAGFSYKKAEAANAISEMDSKRIVSLFLALCEDVEFASYYAQAAEGVDSTPGSMQTQMSKLFKKLRDNNCQLDSDGDTAATGAPPTTTKGKPKAAGKKTKEGTAVDASATTETAKVTSKKRKAGSEKDGDQVDKPKKQTTKKTKKDVPVKEDAIDNAGDSQEAEDAGTE